MEYSTFGRHVAADLWGVSFDKLNDVHTLQSQLIEAAEVSQASVLSVQARQFHPQGATVLLLLAESHLSIHTYPEKGFAAIDCYTCGDTVDPQSAIAHLIEALQPERTHVKKLIRGMGDIMVEDPIVRAIAPSFS